MFQIREYRQVTSLEEAWELNQKKANRIGAGMLWQRMQTRPVGVLIDLSGLGLDQIEETEVSFSLGCMVTLRQMELHEGFSRYTDGAAREAVRHIIGVQFRNLATVGGSLFGRFGFSDVLTLFLALNAEVELYKGGRVPLREFVSMPRDNDILVRVIVPKEEGHFAYESVRTNASTDFPVLTMAAAQLTDGTLRFSVGARPGRAMLFETEPAQLTDSKIQEMAGRMAEQVPVGDSHRGSAAYRTRLVSVLTGRVLKQLRSLEGQENT